MDSRNSIKVIAFVLALLCTYLVMCIKFTSGYEHSKLSGIDDNRRIPLWYPYEIAERYGEYDLHDWREYSDKFCCENGITCGEDALWNILRFNMTSNMIYGVKGKREDCRTTVFEAGCSSNKFSETSYFLFVKGSRSIVLFTKEAEFVKECRKYGVNEMELFDFDENFRQYCLKDKSPSPVNVVKYAIDKRLSLGEFIALVIIWCIFFAVFKICIIS